MVVDGKKAMRFVGMPMIFCDSNEEESMIQGTLWRGDGGMLAELCF